MDIQKAPADTGTPAITVRAFRLEDVESCARIAFAAHQAVSTAHGFPPEHPSVEFSIGIMGNKRKDPNASGIVAETDGRIVGSVFLTTFPGSSVAAVGPLTVDPKTDMGVGRRLMQAVLDEARHRSIVHVRLVQSPSHLRSLALYAKVGFDVREPLVLMNRAAGVTIKSAESVVRPATLHDVPECEALCVEAHGFARTFELRSAIEQQTATVVSRRGVICGYATAIGLRGYAVATANDDLIALVAAAPSILGPGFFVPVRNGDLLRRLLDDGYRSLWPAMLMTIGPYRAPAGTFLPSIAF